MKLTVVAVGRMKGAERELCDRYGKRLVASARQVGLDWRGIAEIGEARAPTAQARMLLEGGSILARADGGGLIALDERGEAVTSEAFARMIGRDRDEGRAGLLFAMGGPDGHADAVRSAAQRVISFGKLTWPHQLARVMLVEQLYRATTILAGHPYHRS